MGSRVQKSRSKDRAEREVEPSPAPAAEVDTDVDDLLAEIDDVLEENAQEFVSSFVQKGGQ